MENSLEHNVRTEQLAEIRQWYAKRLTPLAERGLKDMLLPGGKLFCHRIVSREGRIVQEGKSFRYTAMVMIGLAEQMRAGLEIDWPLEAVWNTLASCGQEVALEDAGLALWALAVRRDPRAEDVAQAISARVSDRSTGLSSMQMGFLLAGSAEAIRNDFGGLAVQTLSQRVYNELLENFCSETGLFVLSRRVLGRLRSRLRVVQHFVNARLGSFASQVYPIIGLSKYSEVTGNQESLRAARKCADAICRHQGPEGQWWWIYHARKGKDAIRYPIYGVHQDAMGPMALLAVALAADTNAYDQNTLKSLQWFEDRPECSGTRIIEDDRAIIWRAVTRDRESQLGSFGLALWDRVQMKMAAFTGKSDKRDLAEGHVWCESRPYHLGWVLLAGAMLEQRWSSTGDQS